ncbi:MAG: sn-glycerol-3-phosphate ABC transporter ATP-binding protein UgpC [Actinobacteria bacterium]|nr:sn-glycerol-3-phosphate ABC transporter ATP-binding protein UgpC [Actinomycetota bacterium]
MAKVILKNVGKSFGNVIAVADVNLEIGDREFLVLVGPSGCGKSTTLRMVAGLEEITSGEIYIGERLINHVAPKDRDIAMVFQNYALYPHMNVHENMAFGLKLRKFPRAEIDRRVKEAAETLGIGHLLRRKPKELSGGQRQRVALGRAIVREPRVFLMDEPLSNLDAKLRVQMRAELAKLHSRLQTTTIYVTHDQTEAMTLGDRIVVMNGGRVQQVGTPGETYNRPANLFVAGFVGSPQMNFLECAVTIEGEAVYLNGGTFRVKVPEVKAGPLKPCNGQNVILGIRPEDVLAGREAERFSESAFAALVEVVEPLGSEVHLYLKSGAHQLTVRAEPGLSARLGEPLPVALKMEKMHAFDRNTERAIF